MAEPTYARSKRGAAPWISVAAIVVVGGIAAYLNRDQWTNLVTKTKQEMNALKPTSACRSTTDSGEIDSGI